MKPIVRWVGGKRKLIPRIEGLLPTTYNTYYEPFAGGLACLLHFKPERAVIGDTCKDLIGVYNAVSRHPYLVAAFLSVFSSQHSKDMYYEVRKEFNARTYGPVERAAAFLYLNAKGYNGLCRYNTKGEYNVPIHKISHMTRPLPSTPRLVEVGRYLSTVRIWYGHYTATLATAGSGDFILADPPYWPSYAGGFTTYGGLGFTSCDQTELRNTLSEARDRGVKVMTFNTGCPPVEALYKGWNIYPVDTKYLVGRTPEGRKKKRVELIITSY